MVDLPMQLSILTHVKNNGKYIVTLNWFQGLFDNKILKQVQNDSYKNKVKEIIK